MAEISAIMIVASVIPSVISGTILVIVNKGFKKSEKLEAARRTESVLVLKNIDAIGTLSDITAKCVKKNERPNGDMDRAMAYRCDMKHALEDHLMEVNAEAKH